MDISEQIDLHFSGQDKSYCTYIKVDHGEYNGLGDDGLDLESRYIETLHQTTPKGSLFQNEFHHQLRGILVERYSCCVDLHFLESPIQMTPTNNEVDNEAVLPERSRELLRQRQFLGTIDLGLLALSTC